MSKNIVVFPSFARDVVSPMEMRQLVQALEARFAGLEQDTFLTIGGEEFSIDDLDARYAPAGHSHTEADITDFGEYLTDLSGSSIFELSDVGRNKTPENNDALVWNAGANRFELVPLTLSGSTLDSLSNVHVPAPNDGDLLAYNATTQRWEASSFADGAFVTLATAQQINGQKTFLADLFMERNSAEGLGNSFSIWFGNDFRRTRLFNNANTGFWIDFQSGHDEPSLRVAAGGMTRFHFDTDSGQHILGGLFWRLYDSTNAGYLEVSHDGSDAKIEGVNTGALIFSGVAVATPASTSTKAGLRVPDGIPPDDPEDGDVWSTGEAMYARIVGETVPLSFDGPGKQALTTIWTLHEWSDGTTRSWAEP